MNARSAQRRYEPEGELVSPLSGPNSGAFARAKRSWRKPLDAILADAIANCHAVTACLQRGMYAPDFEDESRCQIIFDALSRSTHDQLKALETFAEIDWSVR
jgi:hypothetical protein